jgi:ABC-type lipoprotein export system ATPase subunit
MRILRLYIQECGVFHNPTLIDFTHDGAPQDVLCIAGVNGSGKTTVMELLFNLLMLLNPELSLDDIFFDRLKSNILTRVKFAQLDIKFEEKILSLVIGNPDDIQKTNDTQQIFIIEPELSGLISQFENSVVNPAEDGESPKFILRLKALSNDEDFSKRDITKINIDAIKSLMAKIKYSLNEKNDLADFNLPSIYFFNTHSREIQDIRYRLIPNEKPKYKLLHKYSPMQDDLKKTLIYYDYAYQDKFEALKNWLNEHVLIDKSIGKVDRPNFNVLITTKNKNSHGLELLSSGEQSLLIIATVIYLRAYQNSIFLIDEIDESLHPEFQERIMKLIRELQKEKGFQIIVSSHSEIIWQEFKTGLIDLTGMVF